VCRGVETKGYSLYGRMKYSHFTERYGLTPRPMRPCSGHVRVVVSVVVEMTVCGDHRQYLHNTSTSPIERTRRGSFLFSFFFR
jgi:hypothetical protein